MNGEETFLRALAEAPDDDDLRLVFADWLDEQDDPRAELVRQTIHLSRLSWDDPAIQKQELLVDQLRRRDAAAWLGPLEGRIISWQIVRGLLHVRARAETLATLIDDPEARRILHWVRLLDLVGEVSVVTSLLALPDWLVLHTLDLGYNRLGDDGAEELARSPAAAGLSGLLLYSNDIGNVGLRALARSPHLRGLRELNLAGNRLTPQGMSWLTSGKMERLRSLVLSRNPLGDEGVARLESWPGMEGLEHLGLFRAEINPGAAQFLAASPHLASLKTLYLGHNQLQEAGARALSHWRHPGGVEVLELSYTGIGAEGVALLLESPRLTRLHTLWLGNNVLSVEGTRRLAACPGLARLRELELRNASLTDEGALTLASSPYLSPTTWLDLQGNRLSDEVRRELRRRLMRVRS